MPQVSTMMTCGMNKNSVSFSLIIFGVNGFEALKEY